MPEPSPARWEAWRRLAQPPRRSRMPWQEDSAPGQNNHPLDRRERAQAERLVRGVLRRRSLLDAFAGRWGLFNPRQTPDPVLWVLRLAVYEKIFQAQAPDYAIGQESVDLARKAAGPRAARFVNAFARRLLPRLPADPEAMRRDPFWRELKDTDRWSIPQPIIERYRRAYGASADSVLEALAEDESTVWLRVNTLRATAEDLNRELEGEGVEVQPGGLPEAFCWTGGEGRPWESRAWAGGKFTVQDLGAMAAARLLDPQPGQAVADLCAAPGGKTGHLWERMEGRGRLTACEADPDRRAEMRRTLERLYGVSHGIEVAEAAETLVPEAGAAFDRVLVDAPCQALGLIRRHPEARWDNRIKHGEAIRATQSALLEVAGGLTAPGGRLLWVTCSPTRGENEEIVLPWLAAHLHWKLLDPEPCLNRLGMDWVQIDGSFIRTRPDRVCCDGFALALLERGTPS